MIRTIYPEKPYILYLKAIWCYVFLFLSTVSQATELPPAQIAVAPVRATVDISGGRADGSIRLFNLGKNPVNVKTRINNWEMDRDNNVIVVEPGIDSMSNWIIVNPVNFSIKPGGQQIVRYSIRPRGRPREGEHRAMIFFDQENLSTKTGSIGINFSVGVALYAHNGAINKTAKLRGLNINHNDKITIVASDIQNKGNVSVRFQGSVEIWPKSRYPGKTVSAITNSTPLATGPISSKPVLPGDRRIVETKIEVNGSKGQYIALIRGKLGNENVKRIKEFIVP